MSDDEDILDKIEQFIDREILNESKTHNGNESKTHNGNESKTKKSKSQIKAEATRIEIDITRDGTYIKNTKDLPQKILKKIQNYYTLHDKTVLGYINHTSIWAYKYIKDSPELGKVLFIPRFGAVLLENKFTNIKFTNQIISNNPLPKVTYEGIFKGNQEIIFREILKDYFGERNIKKGRGGLTLNLQAGHGKSFIAMCLIGHLKCRTLVVTHNTTKLNEWVDILEQYCTNATIGKYYGKKKCNGDIVVGVINSLVMDEIKLDEFADYLEFYKSFDFVILDECHEFVSKTRRTIYERCQTPYILGLSATPDERSSDSLDKVTKWCCGPILIAEKIKNYTLDDIPFTGHVTRVNYYAPEDYSHYLINEKVNLASNPKHLTQACSDPYRLQMIADITREFYNKSMNILVFADRKEYLEDIRTELKDVDTCILDDLGENVTQAVTKLNEIMNNSIRLVGGASAEDMKTAINSKKIILTTYQYMGTGVSIPALNSVILATPRKTKSRQFINRIFRLGGDYTITRQIIDIVDMKVSLKSQWSTRKEYYDSQNFTYSTRKVTWKDYDL